MRFRGGGVGHTETRTATNKFLQDRDRLDLDTGPTEGSDDEGEANERSSGSEAVGSTGVARSQGGSDDNNENEYEPQGSGGSENDGDEGMGGSDDEEGCTRDLDGDEGRGGDEEKDYGYSYLVDDEDGEDSDAPPDMADDALGPEDGEGDVDEVNMLGFTAF